MGAAAAIIWASIHRLFDPQPLMELGWEFVFVGGQFCSEWFAGLGDVQGRQATTLDCIGSVMPNIW